MAFESQCNQVEDLKLTPIACGEVEMAVRETYLRCCPSISQQVLSHMSRRHIQFAAGLLRTGA
ncbi:hypothetical protein EGR_09517 [Echinococcus granulosus]|uniref:Uncharacterized protein n=1 Tax=Echinococcus granulosus TaxID=6210 RepID=W6UAX3_ECHGR|nr:hypothetical protein EGR_09517 [Echinococcus granulosus]EUB55622.1 hypothetical protein EGR_09517 [Echinococcus granulosus]